MTPAGLTVVAGDRHYGVTLSTAEAAEVLGISAFTCRRRCHDGKLPMLPRSGTEPIRIPTGQLLRMLGIDFTVSTFAPTPQAAAEPVSARTAGSGGRGQPPLAAVAAVPVQDVDPLGGPTHDVAGADNASPAGGEIAERRAG